MHFDLMAKVHQQGRSADDVLPFVPAREKPKFSKKMLSKVYTIIPMIWR